MSRWRPISLWVLLAAAFAAVALVTLGLTSALVIAQQTQIERAHQIKALTGLARQLADTIDRGIEAQLRALQTVAAMADLANADASIDQRRHALNIVQRASPEHALITFISPEGKVIADSRRLLEGADASRHDYFRYGRERPFAADEHDGTILAKSMGDTPFGKPHRFIALSVPVRDASGTLLGVLGAQLSAEWVRAVEADFVAALGDANLTDVMVLAGDGTVQIGPYPLEGTTVPAMSGTQRWPDGRDYLVGTAPGRASSDFAGLGWTVLVRQSPEVLAGSFSPATLQWGAMVAMIAGGCGWALATAITRPQERLARAARRREAGVIDEPFLPSPAGWYREAHVTADAAVRMVAETRRCKAELRDAVRMRELLHREADHRIKNSLQLVASMLQLQRSREKPAAAAALDGAIARVEAVAMAHLALQRSQDLQTVNLGVMLSSTCERFGQLNPHVTVRCGAEDILELDANRAVPLMLIISELLTNALRHAYPPGESGSVSVSMLAEGDAVTITVIDHGTGRSDTASDGLGTIVVRSLAAKLGAQMSTRTGPGEGTKITLHVPIEKPRTAQEQVATI